MRLLLASICLLALAKASPTPVNSADVVPEDAIQKEELPQAQTSSGFFFPRCSDKRTQALPWGLFKPQGPHKCVPTNYMKISCPVVRALAGSGWLEFDVSSKAHQYLTSAAKLLKTMEDILGFTGEEALKPFNGIKKAKHILVKTIKQVNNDKIDLLAMQFFLNHAASTGILGSATHGFGGRRLLGPNVVGKADKDFNKARFTKLKRAAKSGGFSPAEWGSAVNLFASERYDNRHATQSSRVDMTWDKNPFSWAILTLEFSNTLAAFKNSQFNSFYRMTSRRNSDEMAIQSVNDIWQNGHLPTGFVPAKHRAASTKIDMQTLQKTAKSMKVKIPAAILKTMRDNTSEGLKGPKALTQNMCGGETWPNCK